jgi:type IV secretion system protein TrbF
MFKKSKKPTVSERPGEYADKSPEKTIFDKHVSNNVDRNWWRMFSLLCIIGMIVSMWTRVSPPPVTKAYGISSDSKGNVRAEPMAEYKPSDKELRARIAELASDWFTVEPNLNGQISESRTRKRLKKVEQMMVGAAQRQFKEWLDKDSPLPTLANNPRASREVEIRSAQVLPDQTILVDMVTTASTDANAAIKKTRYALSLRYQIDPSDTDTALTINPMGLYIPFFQLSETGLN